MRWFALLVVTLYGTVNAGEPYPLWDGHESVADYAKRVNLPPTKTLNLGDGVKMELVLIPAGKFMMGTPEPEKPVVGQTMVGVSAIITSWIASVCLLKAWKANKWPQFSLAMMLAISLILAIGVWGAVRWQKALHVQRFESEHPAHEVTLTMPFYMGKFTVTRRQYVELMDAVPKPWELTEQPINAYWDEAQAFCRSLNVQHSAAARLPTEAEWEFACRAGTTTDYYTGQGLEGIKQAGWCANNSGGVVHTGGLKTPNLFGLFDMHGNVWQWCQDWYGAYSPDSAIDPQGPERGTSRVLRGGCFSSDIEFCRSAARDRYDPKLWNEIIGFRVVVDP